MNFKQRMNCIALLRGINVGKGHRVEMKKLKALFEALGCHAVRTYINSGNVLFVYSGDLVRLRQRVELELKAVFGFEIPTLIKTEEEMIKIVAAIPDSWKNDEIGRTDVAYLFPEIDSEDILEKLPVKKEYIEVRYQKGAVFWRVERVNLFKSHLNKIIGHPVYKFMTIRNINTARYLANAPLPNKKPAGSGGL